MDKTNRKEDLTADKRVGGRSQCLFWTAPVAGMGCLSDQLALPRCFAEAELEYPWIN